MSALYYHLWGSTCILHFGGMILVYGRMDKMCQIDQKGAPTRAWVRGPHISLY